MLDMSYPIIEIDGEEYVVDISMVLTSIPPKRSAYRLTDKKLTYTPDGWISSGKYMSSFEFYEFMHGKSATVNSGNIAITITGYGQIPNPMDQPFECFYFDVFKDQEEKVVTTLNEIIKNPSGFKMDFLGLKFLNLERRRLGLSEFKYNPATGTFDEEEKD